VKEQKCKGGIIPFRGRGAPLVCVIEITNGSRAGQPLVVHACHDRAYEQDADSVSMATAYTAGIVRNHPFIDGNKRVGFVIGILFLELNGYRFTASEEDAAQAVIQLAAGKLDEAGYSAFLRANCRRSKK
jgi:death-on-curing family protein